jgi:hypothetical protein
MRPWSEVQKQTLRHLAAARFFLPETLKRFDSYDAEGQYVEFLHHKEYGLAIEYLEDIGILNSGFAEEPMFWAELAAAAVLMGRTEDSERFHARL